jgi:hypothetical protein
MHVDPQSVSWLYNYITVWIAEEEHTLRIDNRYSAPEDRTLTCLRLYM